MGFLRPGPVYGRSRKVFALEKLSQNLKSYDCRACRFIHILIIKTEVSFMQEVSGVYIPLFSDTGQLRIALKTRNGSRAKGKPAGPRNGLKIA